MNDIKINYNTVSLKRQLWRDRIQLLSASLCIILGYSETWAGYTGVRILVPIFGFIIAFLNILFARFYRQISQKFGENFEIYLLRLNGVIMLLTGMGYHVLGSLYIQYAYYILSIMLFIVLPKFVLSAKRKKLFLEMNDAQITTHRLIRTVTRSWQDFESILFHNGVLQFTLKGGRKSKKLFLQQTGNSHGVELLDFFQRIKRDHDYSFELISKS